MELIELHRQFRRYCSIEEGLSINTLHDLESKIKTFVKRTGVEKLSGIDLGVIREFFYEGKERYAWSFYTFENYHKYLKKFFNWCVLNKYMKKNPILEIKKPKRPQRLPRRLDGDEPQKILYTAFSLDWKYAYEKVRNYTIIATFLYAGLRRNELTNLELTDINLDDDSMLIRHGKGNKDRYVPIYYKLKPILKRYLLDRKMANKESMYLFVGAKSNKPLTESGIKGIFKRLQIGSGIYVTPHKLRHTFASMAVEKDVALPKVQQILGHSSIQSTMIYLKMSPKALNTGLNAVDLF